MNVAAGIRFNSVCQIKSKLSIIYNENCLINNYLTTPINTPKNRNKISAARIKVGSTNIPFALLIST